MVRIAAFHRDRAAQEAFLNRVSRDHLGALLRAAYEEVAKEPIPDEHVDLLLALPHMERARRRDWEERKRIEE